jgi:hypothetical protein
MIRFLISTILFLILISFELAFIHSLPEPFLYLPLVFACGVYLFQYLGSSIGAWWIFGLGVFLDFWHLGLLPFETIIYIAAALIMVFLGRRIFTNRSLYGVVCNAILPMLFVQLSHLIYWFFASFNDSLPFPWFNFFTYAFWQIIWLVVLVFVLFVLTKKIRSVLKGLLIVPSRENL